jgi:hypothetical protein
MKILIEIKIFGGAILPYLVVVFLRRGGGKFLAARLNRGSVALVHPTTVIGKSSRLAHTLKIDWLRDISTSMYTCRSYDSVNYDVGAASCRD